MTTHIYGLIDPRTGLLRYIGKTIHLHVRLRGHRGDAGRRRVKCRKSVWIRELASCGLAPIMWPIEECDGDGCGEEIFHIALARADGVDLLNATTGGQSPNLTDEIKQKISASLRGHACPDEVREKIRAANKGRPVPKDVLARRVAAQTASWTPERRAACSIRSSGRKASEATRQKMRKPKSEAFRIQARNHRHSEETKRKMSETQLKKFALNPAPKRGPQKPETGRKISASRLSGALQGKNLQLQINRMVGRDFGNWSVKGFARHIPRQPYFWDCVCKCGTSRVVSGRSLQSGRPSSCGCGH